MTAEQSKHPQKIPVLDYGDQPEASKLVLPKSASFSSPAQWTDLHFEVQQQPTHDTGEHLHQMHILTMITSDTPINQSINGQFQRHLVGQNNAFILPAGALHRCDWQQDIEFMFLGIDPHVFVQVGQELVNPDRIELIPHFATLQDPLIQGILFTLKQELITAGIKPDLFVDQLKTTLVTHLLRKYGAQKVKIATYADGLPRHKLNQIIDYIAVHLDSGLELKELAQQVGMSQFYFSRLFKQSLGITPHQYVIQQRVERATQLLRKGELSFAEIALACGFAHQGHLNRHFKRLTGRTPKEINGKNG
ncbi:helix-turn-helix transcriptional regulator [Myxacorys almedinensis]|uniref:Helix-turn-helix domain-containing protein n=1 Tax=Myxacorys almedinensis A TaxID=2690445 RepID=A0A8J8CKC9_9CYAN|nr:AraC family transcriptional regulator [Myxacorys almedinensis]NDJ19414.1 helix-turn-helix domain-containing protein [Myxacorys almedinensis A]